MKTFKKIFPLILFLPMLNYAQSDSAKVSGFAQSFLTTKPIPNATITILETGEKLKTDKTGQFGPFDYPVGKSITLLFQKSGFKTTQSGTFIVPKEGLNSPYTNISFQIPSQFAYKVLSTIIGAKPDRNFCHLATTITKNHRTLYDLPQGEPAAQLIIQPAVDEKPFYFGIFKGWFLTNKTNPFYRHLKTTSEDGGAAFVNLPPREEPYTITAIKNGNKFSKAQFICRKNTFINISPPQGPMVIE